VTGWHWLLIVVEVLAAGGALLHVILRKNDPRAAAYWIALILLVPLAGAALYLLFGINIIHRSARYYREAAGLDHAAVAGHPVPAPIFEPEPEVIAMGPLLDSLRKLSRLEATSGNAVDILRDGDEAIPAMIDAIDRAAQSVCLATYIFEQQGIGSRVVDALARARARGVEVRVMVDDAGTRYAWPPVTTELRRRGVPVARFMPNRFVLRLLTLNMRNHRKILVADGREGFTGGMNIRQGNMLREDPPYPVRDLHFRVRGPAVAQMQRMFAEDWLFCTGEVLSGPRWYPELQPVGDVCAIGIPDGPDEDMGVIATAMASALAAANEEVRIVTPYFLPTPQLLYGLIACALRGVSVRIIVPAKNNIPLIRWASRTMYSPLLRRGIRIFESPPPFDHAKVFTVDGKWTCIGSTNWDPRSLRLNFEFDLACFDETLARGLNREFDARLASATEMTPAHIESLPLPERFRNGVARLFIPLL
jgi:cardiolipin synthase